MLAESGIGSARRLSAARAGPALSMLGVAAVFAATARGAAVDANTIVATYTATSLQVTLNGSPLKSATIAAGSYSVNVNDDPNTGDQNPDFTFNGPGVSVSNNLNSSGMGIDGLTVLGPFTLQAGASYSIEDSNLGPSTLVTFSVSGTSTNSGGTTTSTPSGTGNGGGGVTTTSSSGGAPATTTAKASPPAPAKLPPLTATVTAAGKVALVASGKPVKELKPGDYTLLAVDDSRRAGLLLGKVSGHVLTLSGKSALGKSTHKLALTVGSWFVESAPGAHRLEFKVSG